jgi:hypothetical protein
MLEEESECKWVQQLEEKPVGEWVYQYRQPLTHPPPPLVVHAGVDIDGWGIEVGSS